MSLKQVIFLNIRNSIDGFSINSRIDFYGIFEYSHSVAGDRHSHISYSPVLTLTHRVFESGIIRD